jgi:hypothetical protein
MHDVINCEVRYYDLRNNANLLARVSAKLKYTLVQLADLHYR